MLYALLKLRIIKLYNFIDPFYILDDIISISSESNSEISEELYHTFYIFENTQID
jgi:hypothetical protein